MKQFKIFFHDDTDLTRCAPYEVEDEANSWLSEHPDARILSFITTMSNQQRSSSGYLDTQFALTMLVDLPDLPVETGEEESETTTQTQPLKAVQPAYAEGGAA